mgnify:FL=1
MCIFIFEKKLLEFRVILALKAWRIKTDFIAAFKQLYQNVLSHTLLFSAKINIKVD